MKKSFKYQSIINLAEIDMTLLDYVQCDVLLQQIVRSQLYRLTR